MNFTKPFLEWLLKSDYVKENKLFLNAIQAENNNIGVVTQQISRKDVKHFVDGSKWYKVTFTVFDYKSISFNGLVSTLLKNNENIEDLMDVQKIIDYVESAPDYPYFGDKYEVQAVYPAYLTPSTPTIDNSLGRYSVPIVCEVFESGK